MAGTRRQRVAKAGWRIVEITAQGRHHTARAAYIGANEPHYDIVRTAESRVEAIVEVLDACESDRTTKRMAAEEGIME
jgi:hypothetical protein